MTDIIMLFEDEMEDDELAVSEAVVFKNCENVDQVEDKIEAKNLDIDVDDAVLTLLVDNATGLKVLQSVVEDFEITVIE